MNNLNHLYRRELPHRAVAVYLYLHDRCLLYTSRCV